MNPSAGEIWLVDRGDERRHLLFVISDSRFHRLADRAVVAPVLDSMPAAPRPWHIPIDSRAIAVNQLGTTAVDRLLEQFIAAMSKRCNASGAPCRRSPPDHRLWVWQRHAPTATTARRCSVGLTPKRRLNAVEKPNGLA